MKEKAEKIILDMYSMSMTKALKKNDMHYEKFAECLREVPLLSDGFARAQQFRAEFLADEIVDIADDAEDAQKARNQIDARKWHASKIIPQKFGERIDLNVTQTVDIRVALDLANSRIRDAIAVSTTGLKPAAAEIEGPKIVGSPKNELDELLS